MRNTENPVTSLSAVRSMDPYDFEKLVAEVWSAQGYKTNVRRGSNDKGVDVEAVSGNRKILIQAKRYSANNKIGGPDVRRYATLYQQDPTANQVIIVTTGSFTSQAKEIAAEQNVLLVDGRRFIDMMDKNDITLDNIQETASSRGDHNRKTVSDRSKSTDPELGRVGNELLSLVVSLVLAIPTTAVALILIVTPLAIVFPIFNSEYIELVVYFLSVMFWGIWWENVVRENANKSQNERKKSTRNQDKRTKDGGKKAIRKELQRALSERGRVRLSCGSREGSPESNTIYKLNIYYSDTGKFWNKGCKSKLDFRPQVESDRFRNIKNVDEVVSRSGKTTIRSNREGEEDVELELELIENILDKNNLYFIDIRIN